MLIIDEEVLKSSGDKTEHIKHEPVLFTVDENGKRDYTLEKTRTGFDGEPYVGPLPKVKEADTLSMREIAGNVAFGYITGVRHYVLKGDSEKKDGSIANRFFWFFIVALVGAGVLALNSYFFSR